MKKRSASAVRRKVSIPDGFLFFTDTEHYTGWFATSLADLVEKLGGVSCKAIEFHFQRGDFEDWVDRILGDHDLSNSLRSIDRGVRGEELRGALREIIQRRLKELDGRI